MQLTADQELRRELLLFSLSKHADLEAAIKSAAEMERFVLRGGGADAGAVERLADGKGGARGHSSEPSFGVGREASSDEPLHIMNGHAVAAPVPNGSARKATPGDDWRDDSGVSRSEEHTSELQSLMRISYAVFCLKK